MTRFIVTIPILALIIVANAIGDDSRSPVVNDASAEISWDHFLPLIEEFKAEYPAADREFATVAIGISQSGQRRYWQVGEPIVIDGEPVPSEETIYQIGSITKTFTSLLLADMVEEGHLTLDTTLGEMLPELELAETTAAITLKELATHTSGLARLPVDMMLVDAVVTSHDPYANYTAERLWGALKMTTVDGPGEREYAYSNLGMGLLGQLLADRAETTYPALLQERIMQPLGLADTAIELSESQQQRTATPHLASGSECNAWAFDALAGCGALNSTTADLLTYLEAQMTLNDEALGAAMRLSQQTHYERPGGRLNLGLGWHIFTDKGPHPVYFHNGGTSGYVSFSGFIPETQTAVVILCNSGDALSSNHMVDSLGFDLLESSEEVDEQSDDDSEQ